MTPKTACAFSSKREKKGDKEGKSEKIQEEKEDMEVEDKKARDKKAKEEEESGVEDNGSGVLEAKKTEKTEKTEKVKKSEDSKKVKKVPLTPEERKLRMQAAAQNRRMKNIRKKEENRKDVGHRVAILKKICEDNAVSLVYDESNPKSTKYELEKGQYRALNQHFSKIFNGYMTVKHKKLANTLEKLSNLIQNMQNPEPEDPEFHRLIKKFARFSLQISRSLTSIKNESGFGIMHRALVGSWPRRFTVKKIFKEEASFVDSENSTPKGSDQEDEDEDEEDKDEDEVSSSDGSS